MKKKITKNSHKSYFWHFRKKPQKIHNKEYIYIYIHTHTQIIYINISIYTAEPQETEEGLKVGAEVTTAPVPFTCTPLRESGEEKGRKWTVEFESQNRSKF